MSEILGTYFSLVMGSKGNSFIKLLIIFLNCVNCCFGRIIATIVVFHTNRASIIVFRKPVFATNNCGREMLWLRTNCSRQRVAIKINRLSFKSFYVWNHIVYRSLPIKIADGNSLTNSAVALSFLILSITCPTLMIKIGGDW